MLKNSLRYGLFLFAGLTVWQLIIKQDVEWGMVFGGHFGHQSTGLNERKKRLLKVNK